MKEIKLRSEDERVDWRGEEEERTGLERRGGGQNWTVEERTELEGTELEKTGLERTGDEKRLDETRANETRRDEMR